MKNKFREMRGDLTQKQMVKIINKELEASGFLAFSEVIKMPHIKKVKEFYHIKEWVKEFK